MTRVPRPGFLRAVLCGALVALGTGSLGCVGGPGDAGGSLSVRLTDAPFPHDLVQSIQVRVDNVSADHRTLKGKHRNIVLSETPIEFELLDLRNGVSELLGASNMPRGQVFSVALAISRITLTLTDGRTFTYDPNEQVVATPSPPIATKDGQDRELLLDFDVAMSFRTQPQNPNSVEEIERVDYDPTIRAAAVDMTMGSLVGTVWSDNGTPRNTYDDLPLAGATVSVVRRGIQFAGTLTDADGKFTILHLPQGQYRLETQRRGSELNVMDVGISANRVLTLPSIRLGGMSPLAMRERD